jgi:chromosome segregation ATPase
MSELSSTTASQSIVQLQKSFADVKLQNSNLVQQLAFVHAENAALVIENLELKTQVRDLTGDESVSGAKADRKIRDLASQISELKQVLLNSERSIGALQEENERLKQQLRQEEAKTAQYYGLESAKEIQRLVLETQLLDLQKLQDNLGQALAEARDLCNRLKHEKAAVELELNEAKLANARLICSLQEHDRQTSDAKMKDEEFKSQIQFLRRELQSLRSTDERSRVLESEIEKREEEFTGLGRKYEELVAAHSVAVVELSDLKNRVLNERGEVEALRRQKDTAQRKAQELSVLSTKAIENGRSAARRVVTRLDRQIHGIQTQYLTALVVMNSRVEGLRRGIANLTRVIHSIFLGEGGSSERMRFLRQIQSHLALIDTLNQKYGAMVHFPQDKIPPAADLVNRPKVLENFLRQLTAVGQERHACHHATDEVRSFVRKTYA